jgi:hypothetical protein
MHTDRCGNTRRQKCVKGSGEVKIQEFRYRDTTNVEPKMHVQLYQLKLEPLE